MADHHHLRAQPTLIRARSAQQLVNAPPPPHYYYYEDYWDDHLYSPAADGGARNVHSQYSAVHNVNTFAPAENMGRSLPGDTFDSSSTARSDGNAAMSSRRPFPEPRISEYVSGTGISTDAGVLNSYSDVNGGLRIPHHRPSHYSTLSQGRGDFALPSNQFETSLDRAADLLDLVRSELC